MIPTNWHSIWSIFWQLYLAFYLTYSLTYSGILSGSIRHVYIYILYYYIILYSDIPYGILSGILFGILSNITFWHSVSLGARSGPTTVWRDPQQVGNNPSLSLFFLIVFESGGSNPAQKLDYLFLSPVETSSDSLEAATSEWIHGRNMSKSHLAASYKSPAAVTHARTCAARRGCRKGWSGVEIGNGLCQSVSLWVPLKILSH